MPTLKNSANAAMNFMNEQAASVSEAVVKTKKSHRIRKIADVATFVTITAGAVGGAFLVMKQMTVETEKTETEN